MLKHFHQNFSSTWRILLLFAGLLIISVLFVWSKHSCATTNDARVMTNIVPIASIVNGVVTNISVKDNQYVEQGQVLFELNSEDIKHNLLQGKARISVIEQTIDALKDQVDRVTTELERRKKVVQRSQTEFDTAQKQFNRGSLTRDELDHAKHHLTTALDELEEQQQTVVYAQSRYKHNMMIFHEAKLAEEKATNQMSHLVVRAPVSGYLSNLSLHEGTVIRSYRTLFGIIQPDPVWVIANFMETELVKIRPGQNAKIVVKMYPHHKFKGEVESIGYGIALEADNELNRMLPSVSPNSSWVRLSQRFPVRIRLIGTDKRYPLRVGANAKVKVFTSG